jgi:hypothetical protein
MPPIPIWRISPTTRCKTGYSFDTLAHAPWKKLRTQNIRLQQLTQKQADVRECVTRQPRRNPAIGRWQSSALARSGGAPPAARASPRVSSAGRWRAPWVAGASPSASSPSAAGAAGELRRPAVKGAARKGGALAEAPAGHQSSLLAAAVPPP